MILAHCQLSTCMVTSFHLCDTKVYSREPLEVHFAVVHHHIKKKKKHIYNAVLCKMQILQLPDATPSSPFKRFRVSGVHGKGKGRAL
ncbi:hypothetical protein JVT61DRAFT_11707 [Boletus reticuloceps]|uniref:Uncharacterized protein n=1 Tax=Boletus reticuloceps TaxID=495285 RepID=A0A8I2YX23_9AGAM|nr:hypothetical protein JVT61DRAFT_11707 [Boletus reticuloceps]